MEINHTRIHGKTECPVHVREPEPIEDALNFNAAQYPASLLDLITPPPETPLQVISTQLEINANQIPLAVTREPPVEVQVVPLQPAAALHDAPIEKSTTLFIGSEQPIDLEKRP